MNVIDELDAEILRENCLKKEHVLNTYDNSVVLSSLDLLAYYFAVHDGNFVDQYVMYDVLTDPIPFINLTGIEVRAFDMVVYYRNSYIVIPREVKHDTITKIMRNLMETECHVCYEEIPETLPFKICPKCFNKVCETCFTKITKCPFCRYH